MRPTRLLARALLAITVSGAFITPVFAREAGSSSSSSSSSSSFLAAPPAGFENLTAERQLVLDVYFGGRKLGEARAMLSPGFLRFDDPGAVARLVPEVARLPELQQALSGALASNVSRLCVPPRAGDCGLLEPDRAGVIVDEENFRVEIFVNPRLLAVPAAGTDTYLDQPGGTPSLVSLFGGTVSGSDRGDRSWHLQNRTIASAGAFRLRGDLSLSSRSSLAIDNLSAETERKDWRYVAGVFWAPGTDLVGRRRIVGLGASTQLDTREDKVALMATPLMLYLQQTARVELLVDGRLVTSRIYPAGNRLVDTGGLPDGSYEVVLRIQEDGRPVRTERRFFSKGSQMAPIGRPLFSAFAGMLPVSGRGLAVDGGEFFTQLSAAYRLKPTLGIDATLVGTRHKAILEAGAIWQGRVAQVRLSALVSSSSDHGLALRASSTGQGPVSFSFDLRTIRSRDGRPLIPVTASQGTFSEDPEAGFGDRGSYTQGLAIVGYRLGAANLRLTGLYRRTGSEKSTYNIGASVDMPVVRTGRWDIVLQADARKSERDVATFLGMRFLLNKGSVALSGSAGLSHQSNRPERSSRLVGETQLAWYRRLGDESQLSADGAVGRDLDGSYARASAYARTPLVNARADLLHQFGERDTTQYAATIDGGLLVGKGGVALAGRDMNDSAVSVSVEGGEPGQLFEILVDEVVRGTVRSGGRASLYLQPYEAYDVRLRPRDSGIASFDTAARRVTLYPGNVARLDWTIKPLFVLFGRAVDDAGRPVANADIEGGFGVGRSDGEGYFQIESAGGDLLRFAGGGGAGCKVEVGQGHRRDGYVSGGDLLCRQ